LIHDKSSDDLPWSASVENIWIAWTVAISIVWSVWYLSMPTVHSLLTFAHQIRRRL